MVLRIPALSSPARVPTDACARAETFGPLVSCDALPSRRSTRPSKLARTATGYELSSASRTNRYARSAFRRRVPRRDAVGQQLDIGCRGAPAARRQRQVRNGSPAAGCGCSTSSALAGDGTRTTRAVFRRRRWTWPTSKADLDFRSRRRSVYAGGEDSPDGDGVGELVPPVPACSAARSFACCTRALRLRKLGLIHAQVAAVSAASAAWKCPALG